MSVFIVNTIGMFIKFTDMMYILGRDFLNMMYILGRDFLNIIWSLGLLFSYAYHQKLFMFGFVYGYILKKILEFYVHSLFRGPIVVVGYYVGMRLVKVYQVNLLTDCDPIVTGSPEEILRIKRALTHIGFIHGEIPQRIEFYDEWCNFVKRVEEYEPIENDIGSTDWESDSEEESEDEEEESDDEEEESDDEEEESDDEEEDSDGKGNENGEEKRDFPAALVVPRFRKKCCEEENINKTPEEVQLRALSTRDLLQAEEAKEGAEEEEEEPIKRGWFDWNKDEQSRKTV